MTNQTLVQQSFVDTLTGSRTASTLNRVIEGPYIGAVLGDDSGNAIKEPGIIFGLKGDDTLAGDTVYGGKGNDLIFGNEGDNFLSGNEGNDTIYGGGGNDTSHGGKGDDLIFGGNGISTIYGGQGKDTFDGLSDGYSLPDYDSGEDVLIGAFEVVNGIVRNITISTPVAPVESPIFTSPTPVVVPRIEVPRVEVPRVEVPVVDTLTGAINVPKGSKIQNQLGSQIYNFSTGQATLTGRDGPDQFDQFIIGPVPRSGDGVFFPDGVNPGDKIVLRIPKGDNYKIVTTQPGNPNVADALRERGGSFIREGKTNTSLATIAGPPISPSQISVIYI